MRKKRVLIVSQEINPYLDYTNMGKICNALPKHLLNEGVEMRILMPRFGNINERRHKLHEVVRLSGINIVMGDDDMPLIIKVASMPGVRIQVYFLDNEEFFKRKTDFRDEKEKFHADNAERMVFFCKGAMEIVKKFAWPPDVVHCHGWMTSLIPLYMKTAYKKEPVFCSILWAPIIPLKFLRYEFLLFSSKKISERLSFLSKLLINNFFTNSSASR